jgi:hypothetical protein
LAYLITKDDQSYIKNNIIDEVVIRVNTFKPGSEEAVEERKSLNMCVGNLLGKE